MGQLSIADWVRFSLPLPPATQSYRIESVTQVPAVLNAPMELVTRASISGSSLYTCFGCNGVAKYDISSPFGPTLVGTRQNPGRSALKAIEHNGMVYTTFMSGGIAVESAGSFGSGVQTFYRTPSSANALVPHPSSGFYLADGAGGLFRVTIP